MEYGHDGQHHCDSETHLCDQKCQYEKEALCQEFSKLEFGHMGNHRCPKENYKCQCDCIYHNRNRGCLQRGICKYNLPHEGNHH